MTITEIPQPAAWEDYYTDPHPGIKGSDRITEACGACAGTGLYTAPTWITDSTGRPYCFRCHGTGTYSRLVSSARATARARAKTRAEHVDQVRTITARRAEFEVAHPGLRDRLTEAHIALRDGNPLRTRIGWLLESLEDTTGVLDDHELLDAHAALDQHERELAARRPVPTGRVTVQGEIVSTRTDDTRFGTVVKILVQGDGWRLWGTKPAAVSSAARGDVVEFTATISASDDDESFGFFARPTKAHVIAATILRSA